MPFEKRIYTPGDVPDQTDLNRIGSGIAAVSSEIDMRAAEMRQNADAKIGNRLRADGLSAMVGTLPIESGIVELYGSAQIDGKYNGNSINIAAPSVKLNGIPIETDLTAGMSACMLTLTNYKTSLATYTQYSTITNLGTPGAPLFEIDPASKNRIRIQSVAERIVLIVVTATTISLEGYDPAYYIQTAQYPTLTGSTARSLSDGDHYASVGTAGIYRMSSTVSVNVGIVGGGRTISATVTAMTLD